MTLQFYSVISATALNYLLEAPPLSFHDRTPFWLSQLGLFSSAIFLPLLCLQLPQCTPKPSTLWASVAQHAATDHRLHPNAPGELVNKTDSWAMLALTHSRTLGLVPKAFGFQGTTDVDTLPSLKSLPTTQLCSSHPTQPPEKE